MQSCPSYIPLPTSTPSRVTRLPLSTLLTPNQEISDNAPLTPSTGELSPFTIGPSNQSPSSASAVSSSSNDSIVTISVSSSSSGSNSTVTISTTSMAKENKSPPPIPFAELISPQTVVEKYPKLLKVSKISTLAVRLAKESYFGCKVMASCTVRGVGDQPALPKTELDKLKTFLQKLTMPRFVSSRI